MSQNILRRRKDPRVAPSEPSANWTITSHSSNSGHNAHKSVRGVFKEKMDEDTLELPLLPLREGELERRLKEMDTKQFKFMIPRIAMQAGVQPATPRISADSPSSRDLDTDDLALVRPNAEVIREIREIKKLQFRCGVAIVLVMIVGVLVLACGIGFIIFHAAKLNRQIETGLNKITEANDLLQKHAKPLLDHVKLTLDEGIGHIDVLVNRQVEQLIRVIDGDMGEEVDPKGGVSGNISKVVTRTVNGFNLGRKVLANKKRASNPNSAIDMGKSLKDLGSAAVGAAAAAPKTTVAGAAAVGAGALAYKKMSS